MLNIFKSKKRKAQESAEADIEDQENRAECIRLVQEAVEKTGFQPSPVIVLTEKGVTPQLDFVKVKQFRR